MGGRLNIVNSGRVVIATQTRNVVQVRSQQNVVKVANAAGLVVNVTVQQSSTRLNQASPAAAWIMPHNLGRVPIVQVFLTSGELVGADVIADATSITVTFAQPQSGFIIII
jgi:hypothetical protein